ncbi:MAG: hypothetical protein AAGN66_10560 [Acidobacteriota bacterium]
MDNEFNVTFPAEIQTALEQAVDGLRAELDKLYGDSEAEKMADLHYLAHELVDQQMSEIAAADPDQEQGALLDLREQVGRHVHRLIEATRVG